MGLDMYLYGSKYCGNWSHQEAEETKTYENVMKALGLKKFKQCDGSPHLNVEVCLGYWRKANAIHKWFVNHVQEGIDNCSKYYLNREKLRELKETCETVLRHKDAGDQDEVIQKNLPPQDGFFFGSTAIDDYYWHDLEDTIKQIDNILENDELKDYELYYQSSW